MVEASEGSETVPDAYRITEADQEALVLALKAAEWLTDDAEEGDYALVKCQIAGTDKIVSVICAFSFEPVEQMYELTPIFVLPTDGLLDPPPDTDEIKEMDDIKP